MIAYFSMEIALEPAMPTYSGGLGALAGDMLRTAADLGVPMVAVTLLHRKGYFHQRLDTCGNQTETPVEWTVHDFLKEVPERILVTIEGRVVYVRAWKYELSGAGGLVIPAYFLDTCLPENSEGDRSLTDSLYGLEAHYRLCQEIVLGIGGIRMLRALGYDHFDRYHMNEGHAALLALELLDETARSAGRSMFIHEDVQSVRKKCVFTTHTPVPAGHDQFPMDLVNRVLGRPELFAMKEVFCCEGRLNMTYLALNLSDYVNGVAKRHGEVSQHLFARYVIHAITNGVHANRWTSQPFKELFDRYVPGWREDNFSLRYAMSIPLEEVWNAHRAAKQSLVQYVNRETNVGMDVETLLLGFARRAAGYKRADLLLSYPERLKSMAARVGPIQILFAGKAHPQDEKGKQLIRRVFEAKKELFPEVKVEWLQNYDMELARLLTAGADVWVNTPQPGQEASGTSGMKAALNGVPSLSVLDGWWIEGHIEGVTGWAVGDPAKGDSTPRTEDADSLYDALERTVMPLFYGDRSGFVEVMRHSIALNGSFFNTQRMVQQYVLNAYFK